MINNKKAIFIALIIPIISLALLVAYKKYMLSTGKEITLPIMGYDPRDLLSGYYLIYTVGYGVDGICGETSYQSKKSNGYVCLNPKKFSYSLPKNCALMIKGTCDQSQFYAGIERYYIPEKEAKKLEDLLQLEEASIVLSVLRNGKAQIKDLLINGTSWREH